MKRLDKIDRKILSVLQRSGRIPNVQLAREVGLSPTPCLERVRRLEKQGYIRGYRADLDPAKLDASMLVYAEIRLAHTSPDVFENFKRAVADLPHILECHLVSGDFDYLIKARVKDMSAYRRLLGESLLMLPGVSASRSYIVMEEVKETNVLPISI
jgi:Lrp/AsnC family leucine-responsive transcriptional regulator